MSLIVCPDAWRQWHREEMRPELTLWLREGLTNDAYLIISLVCRKLSSGTLVWKGNHKKHILLQAPLNAKGSTTLALQVEEQQIYLDYSTWEYLERRYLALLALGHGKTEVYTGNLYPYVLRQHGRISDALRLSAELEPYRGSALLDLLSYVTIVDKNSEEESEKDDDTTPDAADAARHGSRPALDGLDGDRLGVQSALPYGHLDAVREQSRLRRTADDEPDAVSQPSLW